jgi:hypothetical protein
MASTLRVLAMLVLFVARSFGMRLSLLPRECHTDVEPHPLPQADRDTIEETETAAANSQSQEGLMVRTIAKAIVDSNHEAGLTGVNAQQQQQQQDNNSETATLLVAQMPRSRPSEAPNPLNRSSSALCRGSRFERRWNSRLSHRRTNQDSRDALRLPENDPLLGLWLNTQPA